MKKFNQFVTAFLFILICTVAQRSTAQCTFSGYITQQSSGGAVVLDAHFSGSSAVLPYSYAWSNGAGQETDTVSTPGIYCVTVTSSNGCVAYACDTLTQICTLSGAISSVITTTHAVLTANVTSGTGTAPYHYHWSNGSTANPLTVTSSGNYCVTVTDSTGCTAVFCDSVHIAGCHIAGLISAGVHSGNIVLTAYVTSGGTAPYQYHWANGTTGDTLQVNASGTYCVTVTDSVGCSAVFCDSVYIAGCHITGSISHVVNTTNAVLTANVTSGSGTPPYHYLWSTGSTSNVLTVTSSGNYCVTVTDTAGCSAVFCDSVYIAGCHITGSISHVVNTTNAVLTTNVTSGSGTPPYHYHWANGSTSSVLTVTASGNYCVTVTDTAGCSAVFCDSVYIAGCHIAGSISHVVNTTNAVLTTNVTSGSGTPPYHYLWSNGSTSSVLTVTASGNYCVTVTDTAGCSAVFCDSVYIAGCHIAGSISHVVNTTNAVLTTNVTSGSGTPPYHYLWSTGSTSSVLTVTSSGNYCVTVTDTTGCSAVFCDSVYIAGCHLAGLISANVHTGNIVLTAYITSGGTAPYHYHWANGSTADTLSVNASGTYCVTVTDSVGCTATLCDSVYIAGCHIAGSISHVVNTTNAILSANVTSGSGYPPYHYHWANGSTSNVLTVTASGSYCVTVTDTTGCSAVFCDSVHITGCHITGSISTHFTSTGATLIGSFGGGSAVLPYTYHWTTGATTDTLHVTTSGTYCLTVTDTSGCSAVFCDSVTIPSCHLSGSISAVVNSTNAVLTAHVTTGSGIAPYHYHWANGTTSNVLTVTASGNYCVTVTDSVGCTAVLCDSVHIVGCHITGSISTTYTSSGATLIGHFGSGSAVLPYTYHWNTGATGDTLHVTSSGTYCLTVSDTSGCFAVFCDSVHLTSYADTICGIVFDDINGNGVQDSGEPGLAGQHVSAGSYSGATDSTGHYLIPTPAGIYTIHYTAPSGYAITIPISSWGPGIYDSVSLGAGMHCGYNFGVLDSNVTITGHAYLDANNNGVRDVGESPVANAEIYIGPFHVFTDVSGYYIWTGPAGTYTVSYTPSGSYSSYVSNPTSRTVNANTTGTIYGGNDFGLETSVATCNIATQIIAVTTVTAGYPSWYNVYVSNYGTNVASGSMTFYYDPALIFNYATPAQTSINTGSRSIVFNYSGLQPGTYQLFTVNFTADSTVTIGQSTFEMATATDNCIESNMTDNTDTVHQNATASWDPNVKSVEPVGIGPAGLIARTQQLRYTIAFQNTGTAPAVNVVLHDPIPATLDLSTLRVVAASHPRYAVQIDGRELICRFSQIMLPDSGTDQLGSHGFLTFEIQPITGIADNTQIRNTADIFFDYNSGVFTNTTLNTISKALSISEIENHATINVAPNPFSVYTRISVTGVALTDATLEVTNLIGQRITTVTISEDGVFLLDRGSMSSGVYIYEIKQQGKSLGSGKLVVE